MLHFPLMSFNIPHSTTTTKMYLSVHEDNAPMAYNKLYWTHLFLAAAARSLCLRFLNQFPTWVGLRPVAFANSRFFVGFGYGSWRYHSRSKLLVRSLKQCVFCSPSQIVGGRGNFFRTRYLSTGPWIVVIYKQK